MSKHNFSSAADLGAYMRDVLSAANAGTNAVTDAEARDAMHALGLTRYEDLTAEDTDEIYAALLANLESEEAPVKRYALCSDVTPSRATVRMLADDREDLCLTHEELIEAGLDDTAKVFEVDANANVGDRIHV